MRPVFRIRLLVYSISCIIIDLRRAKDWECWYVFQIKKTKTRNDNVPVAVLNLHQIRIVQSRGIMNLDKQWMDMIKWFLILSMLTEKYEVLCKANKKNILVVSLLMIGLNREATK